MFLRTTLELSRMTWEQLVDHHALCCKMAADVLTRLTLDEQKYVSELEAEMARRKKNVNLGSYLQ